MLGYSVPNDMSVPSSQCCAWDILQNFLRICEKEPVFAPEISRSGKSEERYIDPQRQWQTLSEHLLQGRYTTTQFPRAGQRKSWRSSVSKNEDSYASSGLHYWCDKVPAPVAFLLDFSHPVVPSFLKMNNLPTMLLTPGPPVNHSVRGSTRGLLRLSKYPLCS